jgi:outer membrane receptor protein involved in Fe transport
MLIKTKLTFQIIVFTFAFLCFAGISLAQSTATLQGTVKDEKGSVVPGAKVTARNLATGIERTTQTDSDGNYQIASLPVGSYSIGVESSGFKRQLVSNMSVEVGRTIEKDFSLEVGTLEQNVNVTADTPIIETTTTSVGQVINQRTVQEIPLNGRHFVDLGLLIPGSVTPPQNGFLTAPLRGQGSFGLNTAGGREDTVNFMINGVNLNDMVQNQITFQPSINTVQEFKADNSTFSAEYGRNSGAIVNIATRSGGNEYHGELFEYLRNDALDARNFFNFCPPGFETCKSQGKPPFKRNQFGGNIGGPINLPHFGEGGSPISYHGKNRSFFFFSYEGLRQRQGLTLPTVTVPTDAQRAAVTDPSILKLLPLIPRSSTGLSSGSATAPVNIDQWTLDVSHNFSPKDRLHGYYAFQRDLRGEPTLQGNNIPGFGDTRQSHRQIFTLNETRIFSSRVVNEARFGFNRIHILFSPNAKLNPLDFNIQDGVTDAIGLPQIAVGGGGINMGGPTGFPQGRSDTTFVFSDTLNYLRGNHSLKFGGELRRFYNNNTNRDTGAFTFANTAAFLAGNANGFTSTLGDVSTAIAQGALGLFVQDNFKVRPNLTLELGLRWDWLMSPTERYDRFADYVLATNSLVRVNNGIAPVYHTNWKNFQPRVGFAWDPFKDGKTSIRAAYAILADQPVTNLVTGNATNPPFATAVALPITIPTTKLSNATSVAVPGATVSPSSSDPNFDNAYVQSWNLNIEREIKPGLAITAGYYASKGTHLRLTRNLNQTFLNAALVATRPFPALSPTSPIAPGVPLQNITFREGTGNSSYNALWVTATKRLSRGLQFNASYTFSKSIDYNSQSSQGVTLQDSNNIKGDRGLSDFDARHRFVISGLYELPFKKDSVLGGWQFSAIVQAQSGNPVTLLAGNAGAIVGGAPAANANSLTGLATLRPDLGTPIVISPTAAATGNGVQWFPNLVCDPRPGGSCPAGAVAILPVAFVSGKTIYHFGSFGRNTIIGPSFNNTDFSIIKRTKVGENKIIEFRWEIFDLFNHANFGQPGRTAQVGSTTFGVITNTRFATGDSGSSRQMQFALKFKF